MKVLKQLRKLILFSLIVQARRARRTGPQVINKVKDGKLYCECGETIIKDGKNQWIQRLMGSNKPVDGKRLRCGYSINDMHSTNLVNTFENRKYKRKCVSKTGFCYSMEMKRKDGTHTSKNIIYVRSLDQSILVPILVPIVYKIHRFLIFLHRKIVESLKTFYR